MGKVLEGINKVLNFTLFELNQTPVSPASILMFILVVLAFYLLSRLVRRILKGGVCSTAWRWSCGHGSRNPMSIVRSARKSTSPFSAPSGKRASRSPFHSGTFTLFCGKNRIKLKS